MKVVHVVAAVIQSDNEEVLLAKRPDHVHKGGLWEFPGGKVETGETPIQALTRELEEELAISVIEAKPLLQVRHDYPEKSVLLDVWSVSRFSGCARGNEGQLIAWVRVEHLDNYQFPEANHGIIKKLQTC